MKSDGLGEAPGLSSVLGAMYQLIAPATPQQPSASSHQLQDSAMQLVAGLLEAPGCSKLLEVTGLLESLSWAICQQPRYRPALTAKIVRALHKYPSLAAAAKVIRLSRWPVCGGECTGVVQYGCAANLGECDYAQAFQLEPVLAVVRQVSHTMNSAFEL